MGLLVFPIDPKLKWVGWYSLDFPMGITYNRGMNPFNIPNYQDLPQKVRTYLAREWSNRDHPASRVGRPAKYPWDEWMDGGHHTALAGRDFHLSVDKFRQTLRAKGYHAGMTVTTAVDKIRLNGPTGPVQFWVRFRFVPKDLDDSPVG